jgi:hypothetical protein
MDNATRTRVAYGVLTAVAQPTVKQLTFALSTRRLTQFRGCNQGGKTLTGAKRAALLLLDCHPLIRYNRPVAGKLVTYSAKQGHIIEATLFKVLPLWAIMPSSLPKQARLLLNQYGYNAPPAIRAKIASIIKSRGFVDGTLTLYNGSTLELGASTQSALAMSSDTLDFVWADEPPKEDHKDELIARVFAKQGFMWLTYTPVGRPVQYLKDMVKRGVIEDIHFRMSVADCPWLTEEKIAQFRRSVAPDRIAQRINGEYDGPIDGNCISAFNDGCIIETVPYSLDGQALDYSVWLWFDHGEQTGHEVCLFVMSASISVTLFTDDGAEIVEDRTLCVVFDEYTNRKATDPFADAKAITSILRKHDISLSMVSGGVGDTNSLGKGSPGKTINGSLTRAFTQIATGKQDTSDMPPVFTIEPAAKTRGNIRLSLQMVNMGFSTATLYLTRNCAKTIEACRYWQGKKDQYKHYVDTLKYGVFKQQRGNYPDIDLVSRPTEFD